MYLFNYLYNFKIINQIIYDVTGSTTDRTTSMGTTLLSGSLPGPVFKTMWKPWKMWLRQKLEHKKKKMLARLKTLK